MNQPAKPRQYRSPNGKPIRVCLKDGRVARIDREWRELPPEFHKLAVQNGAEVNTPTFHANEFPEAELDRPQPTIDAAVRRGLIKMLEDELPGAFNPTTGLPDLTHLQAACGFQVTHDQCKRVWNQLKVEIAEAEAADEQADANAQADAEEEARVRRELGEMVAEAPPEADAPVLPLDPNAVEGETPEEARKRRQAERKAEVKTKLNKLKPTARKRSAAAK